MSYWQFIVRITGILFLSFGWLLTIIPPVIVYYISLLISKLGGFEFSYVAVVCFGTVQFLVFCLCLKDQYEDQQAKDVAELTQAKKKFEKEMDDAKNAFQKRECDFELKMKERQNKLEIFKTNVDNLLRSKTPFRECAKMVADVNKAVFEDAIRFLKNKRNPAMKAADVVNDLKKKVYQAELNERTITNKLEYICDVFPEIADYLNNEEELIDLTEYSEYSELEEQRDRRKDYLSPEEYSKLSDSEKSQLALNRYLKGNKSKRQIGRDYEMCCAFQLRQEGYKVEMHGIKYGLEDLGRDLIAYPAIGGLLGKQVLIIQCKNWNKDRVIHENVIMQLYGSTTAYAIEYKKELDDEIVPVLMIPSYTQVSNTAMSFAEKLKVRIRRTENTDYPRIKCNVNHGAKIYHLPFDQLYDRTEIKHKDECYAYTVKEAESKGFRRAHRHCFND